MQVFLLRFNDDKIVKVYSNIDKLLEDYIAISKNYYGENYGDCIKITLRELESNRYSMSEENRLDLMNFIKENEYQGEFTLEDLEKVDMLFKLRELTLD